MMDLLNLINKYNRPGPRYTSYPPVPFWEGAPSISEWLNHLKVQYQDNQGIDLYLHVPFCEKLCFYCGCHRVISKDRSLASILVDAMIKEWNFYKNNLDQDIKIHSLHFGGGTPTFLPPEELERLLATLVPHFMEHFIGAIEVDPRTCLDGHLEVLSKYGFKRISLGIQDFDPKVQSAINRIQTKEMVLELISKIRKSGFESINLDLIYGLPLQTIQSIEDTFKIVLEINPDQISFYSYAHLPERLKNQKLINESDLPEGNLKRALFEKGKELLVEQGYTDIGMDHFAKPESPLGKAKKAFRLKRNFMGYVDEKANILIGLGPSSISDSGLSFIQNEKDYKKYQNMIDESGLAISHGHTQTEKDLIASKLNQEIMCNGKIDLELANSLNLDNKMELDEYCSDQILIKDQNSYLVTKEGLPFVRNVAMSFDYRLKNKNQTQRFSQTI